MDRKELESAAAAYPNLQGLLFLPIGLVFIAFGIGQLMGDPATPWFYLVSVLIAVPAYWLISRYYCNNYGKVTQPRSRRIKDIAITLFGMAMIIGGLILTTVLDLPISGYAAAYALMMLVYAAATAGLRTHQKLIWGGFLLAALLPIWGAIPDGDEVAVALIPMGIVTMVAGLFDHAAFVRTFGKAATPDGSRV